MGAEDDIEARRRPERHVVVLGAFAAVLVAVAAVVVVVRLDRPSGCSQPTQHWEDIYSLQEDPSAYVRHGCRAAEMSVRSPDRFALLTPGDLEGTWVVQPTTRLVAATVCDVPLPPEDPPSGSVQTELLADPPEEGALTHQLVTYADAATAKRALRTIAALPLSCSHYARPDTPSGTAQIDVHPVVIPRHDEAVGIQLLTTWADGSGQGTVITAVRRGATVSFITVDAVTGGIPDEGYVAEFLDAAERRAARSAEDAAG